MGELKKGEQRGVGRTAGVGHSDGSPGSEKAPHRASESTQGTNRDFDESGEARNQGHGHPREERGDG